MIAGLRPGRPAGALIGMKSNGRTPLSFAAGDGRFKQVENFLVLEGINIAVKDDEGKSALDWATRQLTTEDEVDQESDFYNCNRKKCANLLQAKMTQIAASDSIR